MRRRIVVCAAALIAVGPSTALAQYAPPPGTPPRLCAGEAFVDIVGTPERDTLRAFSRATRVWGLGANDLLVGSASRAACLLGGRGHDVLGLNTGGGVAFGGPGRDAILGSELGDVIRPGEGADGLDAGGGDDKISVRDGNPEVVVCGAGDDIVKGDRTDVLLGCESLNVAGRGAPRLAPRPPTAGADAVVRVGLTAPRAGTYRVMYLTPAGGRGCSGGPVVVSEVSAARGAELRLALRPPAGGWCPGRGRAAVLRYPPSALPPVGVARVSFRVR